MLTCWPLERVDGQEERIYLARKVTDSTEIAIRGDSTELSVYLRR